ncbi:restriction endonuclease subunit S [Algibacter pectinivorans]|uniref:Type I restriction enzyme, S subunit n=1 Tax=Algibacter pectinivorans TaxID=870482 RepID=A0A1I1QQB3_9FLAO|nr:restriction endonuclease subunit S [Algibacter pectinivorans]SFD24239.1 type I restriction enzyme, S subunit [Algibacter pectinivorans]
MRATKTKTSIPNTWKLVNLGDITSYTKGYAFKSINYTNKGSRVIRISDTNAHTIKDDNPIYVSNESGEYKKWELMEGDLVFTTVGSKPPMYDSMVGKVIKVQKKHQGALLNQNAVILRGIKEKVNQNYIYHNFKLKKYLNFIETIVRGNANQVSITLKELFTYKIPLPPLKEQKKIAEILSQWDEAIETTQNLIEKLQLRKKGLMQALLSGKKRLSGFSEEWKEDKLGSYFTERKETGLDNLPLLSVGKEGVYPQDDSNKKDTSNSNKSKYKRICNGDIGYNTMRMWQGRSALSQLEGIVSPAYTILKPKENCDSVFFSHLFKLDDMIHKFYRNSQGMVSDTWMCKFKDFKIVRFNAPSSIEEQKEISKIIGLADVEIEEKKAYLLKLKEQKKGLMQQLLTGKKRVK